MKKYWALFKNTLRNQVKIEQRDDYGVLSAVVGSLCNILLFSSKLLFGFISGSVALIADGLNNLSDLFSQVVTLVSFKISAKPADKNHPYGHARAEYLATTLVSLLIILMGVELLRSAYNSLNESQLPQSSIYSIIVIILSIAIKLWMYFYNHALGLKLNSDLLLATAKDSRNDVLATSAVLISAVVGMLFKINIDPYVGALVAVFVLKTGVQILFDMVNRLMGSTPDPEMFVGIIRQVNSYPEILSTHDLLIHEYGQANIYASIHVSMDAATPLSVSHAIIDKIEREVSKEYGVKLLIHVDPERPMTVAEQRVVRLVQNSVSQINTQYSIHDFQFLGHNAAGQREVSFDVVIPDKEKAEIETLRAQIENSIKAQEPELELYIDFDRAYQRVKTKKSASTLEH